MQDTPDKIRSRFNAKQNRKLNFHKIDRDVDQLLGQGEDHSNPLLSFSSIRPLRLTYTESYLPAMVWHTRIQRKAS